MKISGRQRWWSLKYLVCWIGVAVTIGGLFSSVFVQASPGGAGETAWAAPNFMAVKRVGPIDSIQHQPNYLSNLDCGLVGYRPVDGIGIQTGCFMPTAFGMMDSDSGAVIFNGTDEALQLQPYLANQVLVPWPRALDLVVLDAASTGGSYISLYLDPVMKLQDQRNSSLQLTGKKFTAPADLVLRDPAGKPLVINPQTMAFSSNGSWLAVETLGGSFVRINLATLDVVAFAPAFGSQGSPGLLKSQVTITDDGRYVAIGNDVAASLKVYDLGSCSGPPAGLQPQDCPAHDYWTFVRQQVDGLQSVKHLRFVNDGLLSLEAYSTTPGNNGLYELAPTDSIKSLINYLGLGDSYTSGEGAFDYLEGTDTEDDMCHLSANSYPLLLTHDLFGEAGGHSVACSGAVINDVGNTGSNYRGQVRGVASLEQLQKSQAALLNSIMASYMPGYVAQQRFVQQYQPAIITVSVGGDDIGFSDILQNCVEPHVSLHVSDESCYNTHEDRLELTDLADRTVPRWTALYKQLLAEAPGAKVYAVGYPQVTDSAGNCALNVHLNKSEMVFAEELIDYLNDDIRQAAVKAGVNYVDISQALVGHRLCEAANYDVAVNGLTAGTDGKVLGLAVLGKESYHPNTLGQALIEEAILKQTQNLSSGGTAPVSPGSSGQGILTAPKTGRQVNDVVPDDSLTTRVMRSGVSYSVQADGLRDGLKPNGIYTIRLGGAGGTVLGSTISDATGNLNSNATLPINTVPGGHTIDITGQGQTGQPVDITQPVYVPVSDNDADGDGIPDVRDSCPGIANSGQDHDRDGLDDACDGFIGPAPATTSGPNGGGQNGLSPASLTIVASFTLDNNQPSGTRTPVSVGHIKSEGNHAVDIQTINTLNASGRALRPARPSAAPGLFNKLPAVNWLLWVILPAVGMAIFVYRAEDIPKAAAFNYNRRMVWLRKGFVHFLSIILLVCLVGLAAAAGFSHDLANPDKLKSWLASSTIYDHAVPAVLDQAQKSGTNNGDPGSVSLNDPTVKQAAETAFSPALVEKSVDTFLDGNYSWLEGKAAMPGFNIDLSAAKQQFAKLVGQAAQTHLTSLQVCTPAQLSRISIPVDSVSVSCRPAMLSPQAENTRITQEIENNNNFLSNPVITASSVNQNTQNSQGQPYYQKLSWAPKAYQVATKLPWILGGLGVLSMLGIVFIAPSRRHGMRRIGVVLVEAGVLLIFEKLVADALVKKFSTSSFHNTLASQLKQPVSNFLNTGESHLVKFYSLFGILFLVVGIAILAYIFKTRGAKPPKSKKPTNLPTGDPQASETPSTTASSIHLAPRRDQTPVDAVPSPRPTPPGAPPLGKNPPRPKRPRLIQ